MVWPIVAAIAASAAANELQNQQTNKSDKKAKKAMEAAVAQYENLVPPEIGDYNPDIYQWQGDLSAENIDAGKGIGFEDIGNAMDGISLDPQLRDKQLASMGALDDIISGGGLSAIDKANLSRIQSEASQADKGRRDAIKQNMQARGMGGSGMELLAQLQSSQAATDRQAQQGLDVAGAAQMRALEAIMQQGNMAGNLRTQDYGEQADKAQAANAIAQFNASNKLDAAQFNKQNEMGAKEFNANANNNAMQQNWSGKQGMANSNVDLTNQAQMQNKINKPQQQFDNNMAVASGKANAYTGQQNYYQQQGAQKAKQIGDLINSGTSAVSSYYANKDKK